MEQLNKIIVRGTVGSNRFNLYDGVGNNRFSVVTNFAYRDREGVPQMDEFWHNVVAWEGRGVSLEDLKRITTGRIVQVEGRLRLNKFVNTEGVERQSNEIVASKLSIIEPEEEFSAQMS